jgi:lipopolysaccharide heptosyltransferase I
LRPGDGVLIVRLGAVGDVIRTLPCTAALRRAFPDIRLGWLVERASRSLLPAAPWLDQVLEFPRRDLSAQTLVSDPLRLPEVLPEFLAALRGFQARLAIDFQGSLKSGLLSFLSGASHRLGFDRSGSREGSFVLYNRRVTPSSRRLNRVHKNLELLRPLGIQTGTPVFPFAALEPSPVVSRFLEALGEGARVAIHPGTSDRQAHKRWPEDRYATFVRTLASEGYKPILTWGPGEEGIVRSIESQSGGSAALAPSMNLAEMRSLLMGCRLFVGGDTGPMHLAWTHGVPVVALFGSTDPRINGPLGEGHRILAPAWVEGQAAPRRGDPETMKRITPDQVAAAARELLTPAHALGDTRQA